MRADSTVIVPGVNPIQVFSSELGELTFRWVTIASMEFMDQLLRQKPEAREFTVQLLHYHLTSPDVQADALRALSDPALHTVAAAWAADSHALNATLGKETWPADFVAAAQNLWERSVGELAETAGTVLRAFEAQQRDLAKLLEPPQAVRDMLRLQEVNRRWEEQFRQCFTIARTAEVGYLGEMRRLAETVRKYDLNAITARTGLSWQISDTFAQVMRAEQSVASRWREEFSAITRFATEATRIHRDVLVRVAEVNVFASLGAKLPILNRLDALALATDAVWADWSRHTHLFRDLSAATRAAPTREFYESSITTRALLADEITSAEDQKTVAGPELVPTTPFEETLVDLDPDLIELYRGAVVALERGRADYVRHYSASFRELLRVVLHRLAPDSDVRQWTSDPAAFEKGRPTRRTRLAFAFRAVATPEYAEFVERDIENALAVIEYVNAGTHRVGSAGSSEILDAQLRLMRRRAEAVVVLLMEARRAPR